MMQTIMYCMKLLLVVTALLAVSQAGLFFPNLPHDLTDYLNFKFLTKKEFADREQ